MPGDDPQVVTPKKIVYLLGAGATQAEITYLGAHQVNLLMRDHLELGYGIATRILGELREPWKARFETDGGTDIEKLISLLMASNVHEYQRLAENLRRLYFRDICANLARAQVLPDPRLATGLLALHENGEFKQHETLSGILTTNHDGILQLAARRVYREVNIGIPFQSAQLKANASPIPPLLQLHGSFTWKFGLPLRVSLLRGNTPYSNDTVWIPPTILKESKSYPFNKLAGLAYELLSKHCDILRVIGCALTQNDWNVLSMIFNAQRHRELTRGASFRIELVLNHDEGVQIARDISYLSNVTPIGFLTEGEFAGYREQTADQHTSEMKNPFHYWLKEKINFHMLRKHVGPMPIDDAIAGIVEEAAVGRTP